ncbi:MAG TPA: glycoside hydrolase family 43 protein [Blastocatellia bacterium]|nr:glycoside hydrolase family 43 protein [Blastocatellia bacterium]
MTTYLNPVHNRPCPDPFVLKHRGEYWCYTTGFWHDGRCFGILHSRDLVDWREMNGAMAPFDDGSTCYWAPEVIYENGRFLMYYSVGNETRMHIRVAAASHPAGPFVDTGHALTAQEFAIDPHVFIDDGKRFLFYATDFLEHTRIGTGTVVDRMIDEFTLAGRPHPVTRAKYDWQIYDPNRAEKGGVRWHTVEGPFVLKRKGVYYEMFSGGNWKNLTYGVSYAITRELESPEEWAQVADGKSVLPILRTIPGLVIGPGHNSVALGPDNRQHFCVYHRWADDGSDRVLAIDRQDWAGERMIVLGPSTTPQPSPNLPTFSDFFEREAQADSGRRFRWGYEGGEWVTGDQELAQESLASRALARLSSFTPSFAVEVSLRALESGRAGSHSDGSYGVSIFDQENEVVRFRIELAAGVAALSCRIGERQLSIEPAQAFQPTAYHLLRVEVDGSIARLWLDGMPFWQGRFDGEANALALVTEGMGAAYSGFSLTGGWEDLFEGEPGDPGRSGWRALSGDWEITGECLVQSNGKVEDAVIVKGPPLDSYEVVVNARLDEAAPTGSGYGFYPALDHEGRGPLFVVSRAGERWSLVLEGDPRAAALTLPENFDPYNHQQFRFRKEGARLFFQWEAGTPREVGVRPGPARPGLCARGARASFDMVRVTATGESA